MFSKDLRNHYRLLKFELCFQYWDFSISWIIDENGNMTEQQQIIEPDLNFKPFMFVSNRGFQNRESVSTLESFSHGPRIKFNKNKINPRSGKMTVIVDNRSDSLNESSNIEDIFSPDFDTPRASLHTMEFKFKFASSIIQ